MAQTRQRQRTRSRDDDAPIIPILARKVREVEQKAQKGKLGPTNRTKFQVIALLMREERARVKADTEVADGARAELLKRLDGIAQILAKTAARDTSLIALLEPDASISTVAQRFRRDWLLESGAELSPDELIITREPEAKLELDENQVIPASVRSRQLANPFLAPDFSKPAAPIVPCGASPTGSCSARCSSRSRWAPAGAPPRWSSPRRPPSTASRRAASSS